MVVEEVGIKAVQSLKFRGCRDFKGFKRFSALVSSCRGGR